MYFLLLGRGGGWHTVVQLVEALTMVSLEFFTDINLGSTQLIIAMNTRNILGVKPAGA